MAVGRKSPYMGHKVKMECTRGDLDKVDQCVNKNSQFRPSFYDVQLWLITTAIASTGSDGWGR